MPGKVGRHRIGRLKFLTIQTNFTTTTGNFSRSTTCIPPFQNEKEEYVSPNYPKYVCHQIIGHWTLATLHDRCADLPQCKRCDDLCAERDGKKDKDDYKRKQEPSGKGVYVDEIENGHCTYVCTDWPLENCQVYLWILQCNYSFIKFSDEFNLDQQYHQNF